MSLHRKDSEKIFFYVMKAPFIIYNIMPNFSQTNYHYFGKSFLILAAMTPIDNMTCLFLVF